MMVKRICHVKHNVRRDTYSSRAFYLKSNQAQPFTLFEAQHHVRPVWIMRT